MTGTNTVWDDLREHLVSSDLDISIQVVDTTATPLTLLALQEQRPMEIASLGKLPLLTAASHALDAGTLHAGTMIGVHPTQRAGGTGLWQYTPGLPLPIEVACQLVGAVSDNSATNALIRALRGPAEVMRIARDNGHTGIDLHDYVRDIRTPPHPAVFAYGTAAACANWWINSLRTSAGRRARRFTAGGQDTRMITGPLDRHRYDQGVTILNKTGTDKGIRGDTGTVIVGSRSITYAAIANWGDRGIIEHLAADEATRLMRTVGEAIRDHLTYTPTDAPPPQYSEQDFAVDSATSTIDGDAWGDPLAQPHCPACETVLQDIAGGFYCHTCQQAFHATFSRTWQHSQEHP